MTRLARRVDGLTTSIFAEMSELAARHGAVNLGQGFPDFDGPPEVVEAAHRAMREGLNQYAPSAGIPALRGAIAEHSARFYGMTVDPSTMITITAGATEAIFDAVLGLVDPGDEVILFEPFYDSYQASVAMAGGVARVVLLRPPDVTHPTWWFDRDELTTQFSARTRLVILNTPHNPTGKVFTRPELELLAELCERHDAYVLADEVYEHLVYEPGRHLRLATLPGMRGRTLTVSSGGKTFSLTGWKVGWAIAEPALRAAVQQTHQFVTFATPAPLQAGIACGLALPDSYFEGLGTAYAARREVLTRALDRAPLKVFRPEGSYFVLADVSAAGLGDDVEFCRQLIREVGVAAIPLSGFYVEEHRRHGRALARFAFCKQDPTLASAAARLERLARPSSSLGPGP